MNWIALLVAIAANATANLCFKRAVRNTPAVPDIDSIIALAANPWMWAGGAACGVLVAAYLYAIRGTDLAVAYAVVTCGALVAITLAAHILFDEMIGIPRIVGMFAVTAGLWLLVAVDPESWTCR